MKYIDAEKLIAEIKRKIESIKNCPFQLASFGEEKKSEGELIAYKDTLSVITSLQQEQTDMGEVSDGYHTFNELYYYRMLYNAAFFNLLPKEWVHKSKRHHTGEECFGGGWFIVMANLPTGQISNHYELKDWELFKVPEKEVADEWDGHTPQKAAERLHKYLQPEQPNKYETALEKAREWMPNVNQGGHAILIDIFPELGEGLDSRYGGRKQEQPEVDLEKEANECWDYVFSAIGWDENSLMTMNHKEFLAFARHFYELGLNSRKEK